MGEQLLDISKHGNKIVVEVLSRHLNMYHIPDLKDEMSSVIAQRPPQIILNLSGVDYLDSSAMGALFHFKREVDKYQGKILLSGVNQTIAIVFRLTKSDQHFPIYETVEEALA